MKLIAVACLGICLTLQTAVNVLAIQFTFQPRIGASEEYTTNVFLEKDDEQDDFITTAELGFTAAALGKNGALELSYDPSYAWYKEFDENNRWRQNAQLRAFTQPSKNSRLEVRDSFLLTEDPAPREDLRVFRQQVIDPETDQPLIQTDPTSRQERNKYWTNVAAIGFENRFGRDDTFGLDYQYRILNNSGSTYEDSEGHDLQGDVTYWFGIRNGIGLDAGYLKGLYGGDSEDFDDYSGTVRYIHRFSKHLDGFVGYRHIFRDYEGGTGEVNEFDQEQVDYQVFNPSVGVDWAITKDSFFNASVGGFYQDRETGDNQQGLTLDGNIGTSWESRRGAVDLIGSTGFDSQDFASEVLGFNQFYQIQSKAYYDFTRRLRGDVILALRRSEYLNTDTDRDDNIVRGGAGLDFQVLKWMFLSLEYNYRYLDSTEATNDYTEHRGLLRVTLTTERPFRTVQ